jgi:hypothetical protein
MLLACAIPSHGLLTLLNHLLVFDALTLVLLLLAVAHYVKSCIASMAAHGQCLLTSTMPPGAVLWCCCMLLHTSRSTSSLSVSNLLLFVTAEPPSFIKQ